MGNFLEGKRLCVREPVGQHMTNMERHTVTTYDKLLDNRSSALARIGLEAQHGVVALLPRQPSAPLPITLTVCVPSYTHVQGRQGRAVSVEGLIVDADELLWWVVSARFLPVARRIDVLSLGSAGR